MTHTVNFDVAEFSGLHSLTLEEAKSDAEHAFSRGYEWLSGTEAGEDPLKSALADAAKRHGYTFHQYKSNWISIRRSLFLPLSHTRGEQTVVNNDDVVGRGHDLNFIWDTFRVAKVGTITVMASHYATRGTPIGDAAHRVNLADNKKLAYAIGAKARVFSAGKKLVFYAGDQNIVDRLTDTFFGVPFTSVWDELHRWDNTGHGNIDVIASYDPDTRVRARYARALDDSELHQYSDHYPVEAGFAVRTLR